MGYPSPSLVIITPSCLRVDKAIIFFKSHSVTAEMPAISIVKQAVRIKQVLNIFKVDKKG